MNYDDLRRMEEYSDNVRKNAFRDCAARISHIVDYHLAANPGLGLAQMNETQLYDLIHDVVLVVDQIKMYGERMPDGE